MAQSYGICALCGKRTTKGAMHRHLDSCVPDHQPKKGATKTLYRLRVEGGPDYWLDIDIDAKQPLAKLDDFLRDIWLECCGHLSAFYINGESYQSSLAGCFDDEKSMNHRLADVISEPGETMEYEYDFGSTTGLDLKLTRVRRGPLKGPLRVLARNEPPVFPCEDCDEPATVVCAFCYWRYCEVHAMEHTCGDEGLLPLVNSPRAGVCGYTGN